MPTMTLQGLNRLNIGGRIFERGVEVPVDLKTALKHEDNPRFKVRGLVGADPDQIRTAREAIAREDNADEIRAIADDLDLDVEDNFTANGMPSAVAISKVIGYTVTQEQVDRAMLNAPASAPPADDLEEATPKVTLKPKRKPEAQVEV